MKLNPASELLGLFYPSLCVSCSVSLLRNESYVCMTCLNSLPRTNYHLQSDNPVEKRFWGKVPVLAATSFFHFQKGSSFQKLLHALKYKGTKEVGMVMGKYAAADLLSNPVFDRVDIVVPVPLHPRKLKQRGYNQSEWIAMGIGQILGKPVDTNTLVRIRENTTQTKKNVWERFENTERVFGLLNENTLAGKHVLLVDDVLTTGSTLEACIQAILKSSDVQVSVFTLAIA